MKKTLTLIRSFAAVVVALSATSAFAHQKLVCSEYDRTTDKLKQKTVVLTQLDEQGLVEGVKLPYSFSLYNDAETYPDLDLKGTVETEDVSFQFTSEDGKTTFHVYLDEMDEASLERDGKQAGDYVCR